MIPDAFELYHKPATRFTIKHGAASEIAINIVKMHPSQSVQSESGLECCWNL